MSEPTQTDGGSYLDPQATAGVDIDALRAGRSPAEQLLIDLVATPSPSGAEGACADRLVAFFEAHDREVFIDRVGNVRAPGDDAVLLTSHIDTVPGAVPVRIDEETLWGRGAVDATGPLAAMAVAAVDTGVSFAGVVREETTSEGAWHLIDDRPAPDAVINGEPSGVDGITLGYRGFLSGTYVATSELGHSSRPADNAIQSAVRWWSRVDSFFDEPDAEGVFDTVTTKPVAFTGGPTEDGLAVEATVDVQFRIPPKYTIDDVQEVAEGELTAGSVHWIDPIPPVMQSPRTAVARAFRAAIRAQGYTPRPLRKTGTSDMNIYAGAWDCPMVSYGPGDSGLDHAPDEHLPLAAYADAIDVLTAVAQRLSQGV
jgi:acetylornithine deacetylase (EC 3.5.1.16)/N2-acetyl-L-lysine deacetylase (EC 3.5.1.-)